MDEIGSRRFEMDETAVGDGTAPGADKGQRWPDHDRLGQNRVLHPSVNAIRQGQSVAQRAMTPDEIRVDELKSLAERISLVGYGRQVREIERIVKGRIEALRPEQTSSDEDRRAQTVSDLLTGDTNVNKVRAAEGLPALPLNDADFHEMNGRLAREMGYVGLKADGLPYRQEVTAGLSLTPNSPDESRIIHGKRLDIDVTIPAGRSAYDIPPYQVDQLRAIADGRPSWPDTSVPNSRNEQADLSSQIEEGVRILSLWAEHRVLLTEFSAALLADDLADAIRALLKQK